MAPMVRQRKGRVASRARSECAIVIRGACHPYDALARLFEVYPGHDGLSAIRASEFMNIRRLSE